MRSMNCVSRLPGWLTLLLIQQGERLSSLPLWIFIAGISVFAGASCAILPWFVPVGGVVLVLYLTLAWFRPWLGFFLYSVFAICAPDFKVADFLTVVSLVVVGLRSRVGLSGFSLPVSIRFPMKCFAASVAMGFAVGVFYFHNSLPFVYRDGRVFLYWLWVPVVWQLLKKERLDSEPVTKIFVAVAVVISLLAVFQSVTGLQVVAVGRVGALETAGASQGELTRVQLPGYLFVLWSFVWCLLSLLYKRISPGLGLGLVVLFVCALYVNFGRALWIWSAVAVAVSLLLVDARRAAKLVAAICLSLSVVLPVAWLVKPAAVEAVAVRLLSVKDEGGRNTSYGWREWENGDAISALKKSPIVGVGVGGAYRKWFAVLKDFEDHPRYIHNSYLFVYLKVGLVGVVSLLWALVGAWIKALIVIKGESKVFGVGLVATIASLPAIMGLSLTQPELMNTYSVIFYSATLCLLNFFGSAGPGLVALKEEVA